MTSPTMVFVTGTNTDVGKTVVSAALLAVARSAGARVAYVKPAQTGLQPGEPGSDADVVRSLVGDVETHEFTRLPDPLAPAAAARVVGATIPTVADHARRLADLAGRADLDLVLVEGAGGLLVQLDREGGTQADLARALVRETAGRGTEVSFVVVADPVLGTLNLCALTQEALDSRGLSCAGYVFGTWPATHGDLPLVLQQNVVDVPAVTGRPLLGRVPAGAGRLPVPDFVAAAPTWLPGWTAGGTSAAAALTECP